MERRTRHTLNTILGWVGYGLSNCGTTPALTGRQNSKGPLAEAEPQITAARVATIAEEISDLRVMSINRQIVLSQLALVGEAAEQGRDATATKLARVADELADLRSQLSALRESTERAPETAAQVTDVTAEIADLDARLARLNESAEPGREATAARVEEVVEQSADLGRQWADLRQRIEQPGNGSDPELRARPEKPGRTASSQPETPSASTIERGGGPVSTVGRPPSSKNPSASIDGDGANASSFFRWPSLLAFPKVLATHMPRFLTRMRRQDTEDLSESVGRPPEHEVPVAVERLRKMVRSDTLDIAPGGLSRSTSSSPRAATAAQELTSGHHRPGVYGDAHGDDRKLTECPIIGP